MNSENQNRKGKKRRRSEANLPDLEEEGEGAQIKKAIVERGSDGLVVVQNILIENKKVESEDNWNLQN
jgi:hypothetical protein